MKYVIFLRGVNVSGKNKLNMKDLKQELSIHFKNVKTYIQSGNILLETELSLVELTNRLNIILELFSINTPLFIFNEIEFLDLINNNPFKNEFIEKLHITISNQVIETDLTVLNSISSDKISAYKSFLYILCENGYGNTKLNNNYLEKKLSVISSTRNWKTVLALKELFKN